MRGPQTTARFPTRLLALCVASMLSACTVLGPEFQEPEVAWLSDWETDFYGQIGNSDEQFQRDLQFWWRLFDDPVLNELIETAKRENPSLRVAGLRILESRARLGIARSNLYPQLQQATGGITYINTQQHGGKVSDDQDFTDYQAGLNLGWELDFWGRFRRGLESADAAFFASIANQQDVQVLLSAQVADLYFGYRTTLLAIDIARKNATEQKRSYAITERLFNEGQTSELDLQQAKTQYLATLSTIPNFEIQLIEIRNALCALLGRAPGDIPEIEGAAGKLPLVEPVVLQGIPARFLLRRPDIRSAAWQVAAQSAQIGIAEADFYPSISLLGSVGWSGNTLSGSPDTGSLAIGPAFTWNVFDHGRISNNVRVQDARLQQTIESYQDAVLQAAREIDDAAINVVKTREKLPLLNESLQAAQRSLNLAITLYVEGYVDFQRVLDAQRAVFAQAQNELSSRGGHISAVINLYKAIGGGWLDMPIEQIVAEPERASMKARSDWGDLLDAPLPARAEATSTGSGASP